MQMAHKALATLALALPFVPSVAHAAQAYDNCTGFIDSLPAVIGTQGTWCLRKDLSTSMASGFAVLVTTNNVTIDCNDFKIGGLSAGAATWARGIAAQDRQNIAVRNCNVRGFHTGIWLQGTSGGGHVVERNRLSGNTSVGILVQGEGSSIERNSVLDTGGSTHSHATAISSFGADIIDNLVSGVSAVPGSDHSAGGIGVDGEMTVSVRGNRIRGLFGDGLASSFGISATGGAVVTGNQLSGRGSPFDMAIYCDEPNAVAYRDNVLKGFGMGVHAECVDGGGNTQLP